MYVYILFIQLSTSFRGLQFFFAFSFCTKNGYFLQNKRIDFCKKNGFNFGLLQKNRIQFRFILDMRSRFLDFFLGGEGWPLLGRWRFRHNFSRNFCGNFEAYFLEGFHQKKLGIFTAWFLEGFWPEIIGDFYSMMFRGIPPRENWGFLQHDF